MGEAGLPIIRPPDRMPICPAASTHLKTNQPTSTQSLFQPTPLPQHSPTPQLSMCALCCTRPCCAS